MELRQWLDQLAYDGRGRLRRRRDDRVFIRYRTGRESSEHALLECRVEGAERFRNAGVHLETRQQMRARGGRALVVLLGLEPRVAGGTVVYERQVDGFVERQDFNAGRDRPRVLR